MRIFLASILMCSLSGCAVHYANVKTITGKGKDIKTSYGTVRGATVDFKSRVDVWVPWKMKD